MQIQIQFKLPGAAAAAVHYRHSEQAGTILPLQLLKEVYIPQAREHWAQTHWRPSPRDVLGAVLGYEDSKPLSLLAGVHSYKDVPGF